MSKSKSKSKQKDKKKDIDPLLQGQLDQQKRKIFQSDFTIRKLQDRLQRLILENKSVTQKYDELRQSTQQQIQKLKIVIQSKKKEINNLQTKCSLQQIENKQKQNRIKALQLHLNEQIDKKNKQIQSIKQTSSTDIKTFQGKLKQFQAFMQQKSEMKKKIQQLKQQLQFQKADKIRQIAEKDRQKATATDKLKNDMLHRIQQTKTSLQALKKQQLSTTTRLTVLQNHQLTSQLQYQSKQTQKLLFKNQQLQNKVMNLTRDLQIHKQVQQQLAKRSHFSRGIIKKLTQRISELEQGLQKKQIQQQNNLGKNESKRSVNDKKYEINNGNEKTIQKLQKKYSKLESEYEVLKNQNYYLQTRLDEFQSKLVKVGNLLIQYYQKILNGQYEVKDENYSYDLRQLKNKSVKQWTKQDIKLTVTILLNLIKPILSKKNITFSIPSLNKNLIIIDDQQQLNSTPLNLPKINLQSGTKQRKTQIKSRLHEVPINVATKIVGSSLRQWGKSVGNTGSSINLSRKYRINQSIK